MEGRKIMKKMGVQLKNNNLINNEKDVFYLTVDEIFGLVDGSIIDVDLKKLIELRKEEYKKMSSTRMKELVNEEYDKLERVLDMRGNEGKDKKKAASSAKSSLKNRNIPQNKIGKMFKNNAGRVPKNAKII